MTPPTETNDADDAQDSAQDAAPAAPSQRTETSAASGIGGKFGAYLPARREALFLLGGGLLGGAVAGGGTLLSQRPPADVVRDDAVEISAREGRERLEAGNKRFVSGELIHPDQTADRRAAIAASQKPFCAVLSCADSRVPPEVIFDQGIGDLFVVRSAGQVVDHAVLGSLQYGVEHLGVPLLVVLGHSQCGAVKATIEAIESKAKPSGTDIDALVTAITPAVHEAEEIGASESSLLGVSIDINVERVSEKLKQAALIAEAAALRKVKILGAVYSVKTGEVTWL
jgi:carbonic anhydrase